MVGYICKIVSEGCCEKKRKPSKGKRVGKIGHRKLSTGYLK